MIKKYWLAMLLCVPLWVAAQTTVQPVMPAPEDPVANQRAMALASQLRCLVCQNQSIAESNASLALDLRTQIREQIAQGKSDSDITAYMVARYGDFVLYKPPLKATTLLLWFGPPLLLLIGLILLIRYMSKRRARIAASPLSEDERRTARELLSDRPVATKKKKAR